MLINPFSFLISDFINLIFCAGHNDNPDPDPNRRFLTVTEAESQLSALQPQLTELKNEIEDKLKESPLLGFSANYFLTLIDIQTQVNAIKEKGPHEDFYDRDSIF